MTEAGVILDHHGNPIPRSTAAPWMLKAGDSTPYRETATGRTLNSQIDAGRKPGARLSMGTLRVLAVNYPVARACISYRQSQVAALQWEIVPRDNTDPPQSAIDRAVEFFSTKGGLGGPGKRVRTFISMMLDDLLTLDAVCLYRRPARDGSIHSLLQLAPETIKVLVDDKGWQPAPPNPAYRQYIDGKMVGQWTADEMRYEYLNARTSTVYGLAPLETLITTVEAALRAEIWNLDRFTRGNIPEGLLQLPAEWTTDQIKAFGDYWNAITKGKDRAGQMKFAPAGGDYIRFNQPGDMEFERQLGWLAALTCAVFGVNETAIGLSGNTYKYAQEGQREAAQDTGLVPLLAFTKEIFDDILAEDVGEPDLEFRWPSLDKEDEKVIAEVDKLRIEAGIVSRNEVRMERGYEAIDDILMDVPMVITSGQPLPLSRTDEWEAEQNDDANAQENAGEAPQQEHQSEQENAGASGTESGAAPNQSGESVTGRAKRLLWLDELRKFRRKCLNAVNGGKPVPMFVPDVLPMQTVTELRLALSLAGDNAVMVREVLDSAVAMFEKATK